jgi:hypothetical protein
VSRTEEVRVQTENKRACATCGAANRTDIATCWQCFAPLGAVMPPAPGMSASGSPTPLGVPAIPPAVASVGTGGTNKAGRIVVGLLAAFLGYIGVQQVLGGSGVEIPDTVAGVPRLQGGMAARFEEEMAAEVDGYGMDAEAGAFGTGVPEFLLVVVNGSTPETTDEMFDAFVEGMSQSGASVDTAQRTGELDGASYRCVGAQAQGTGVGVCMWRADDHVGIVLDLTGDTISTETLLRSVYDDVAG